MKKSNIFLGLLILMLFACKKDNILAPADNSPSSNSNVLYFDANVNGKRMILQNNKDGFTNVTDENGGFIDGNYQQHLGTSFFIPGRADLLLNIGIIKTFDTIPTNSQKLTAFSEKSYSFGVSRLRDSVNVRDGAYMEYLDEKLSLWTTDQGAADQSNSVFTIKKIKDNEIDGKSLKVIEGIISCKLYDDMGNVMEVKNGYFRGKVISK